MDQKAELTKAHKEELEAVRQNVIADAAEASKNKSCQELYTLTKFLCGAATLRGQEGQDSIENQAFEGVLYQVYGGSQEAVSNMVKLIDGSDEKITSADGKELDFTCQCYSTTIPRPLTDLGFIDADVKKSSDRFAAVEDDCDTSTETIPASDPTLANAGLTELQDTPLTNGAPVASNADPLAPPTQTLVDDAANNVAEKSTDALIELDETTGVLIKLGETDAVTIPRDPAETETGLQATPASADAGLSNGSAGVDAAGQSAESKSKKSGGRRRQNNRPRDGQQAREGQQPQREGQKSPREVSGKRGDSKAQREQGEQAPREGQQVSREGRGRGGGRGGGRGRGGRGRGRGAQGAGNGSTEPSVPASKPSE